MKACVIIQIWEFFTAMGIDPLPQSSIRIACQFGLVLSADLVGFVQFGLLSPKIGFEFGVFGSGSVRFPSLVEAVTVKPC